MSSVKVFPKIRTRGRPPTVTQQVAEHLARLIAAGTLEPGEKLPGTVALARHLKVSRPTLRQALRALEARGLLEIRPRSGTYVREPGPAVGAEPLGELLGFEPGDLWELLELRKIVDPAGAALAAGRRTPAQLAALREVVRSAAEVRSERLLTWQHAARVYGRFFSLLAEASHNRLLLRLAEGLAGMLRDALAYSRLQLAGRPGAGKAIRVQLGAILAAVEAGDGSAARGATLAHLDYVERTLREIRRDPGR